MESGNQLKLGMTLENLMGDLGSYGFVSAFNTIRAGGAYIVGIDNIIIHDAVDLEVNHE